MQGNEWNDIGAPGVDKQAVTQQLLHQWNEGDEQSLNKLLDRHLGWIREYAHRRLGAFLRSKGETCDFVQDAMVEFLRYGPRIRITDENHFRALIMRIVENTVRGKHDFFMAQRRRISRQQPLPSDTVLSLDPPKVGVERPSQAALKNEQEAWVRLGLELIDPADSEIIVLHQWTGLPFAKIAEQLQITAEAATMRHSRAVSKLGRVVARLRRGELAEVVGSDWE